MLTAFLLPVLGLGVTKRVSSKFCYGSPLSAVMPLLKYTKFSMTLGFFFPATAKSYTAKYNGQTCQTTIRRNLHQSLCITYNKLSLLGTLAI